MQVPPLNLAMNLSYFPRIVDQERINFLGTLHFLASSQILYCSAHLANLSWSNLRTIIRA